MHECDALPRPFLSPHPSHARRAPAGMSAAVSCPHVGGQRLCVGNAAHRSAAGARSSRRELVARGTDAGCAADHRAASSTPLALRAGEEGLPALVRGCAASSAQLLRQPPPVQACSSTLHPNAHTHAPTHAQPPLSILALALTYLLQFLPPQLLPPVQSDRRPRPHCSVTAAAPPLRAPRLQLRAELAALL